MSLSKNVLITGSTGFIGQALQNLLATKKNINIRVLPRLKQEKTTEGAATPMASSGILWPKTLLPNDITTLVHLAGRAHVLKETSGNPLEHYRADNVESTLYLAKQALNAGVKRFIFISSIGVNGSSTTCTPFNELSIPAPKADYAISKLEAEQGLHDLLQDSGMELVIIRPPLVYAGHAPGNFRRLLKLVASGAPLPFASVNNRRSMISLENLVDFIALCIEHPAAAGETFLISDGLDFSTPQIIRHLATGLGRKAILLPIPLTLMQLSSRLLGLEGTYDQLCRSLVIDSSKARNLLEWHPPIDTSQALINAGRDFDAMLTKPK